VAVSRSVGGSWFASCCAAFWNRVMPARAIIYSVCASIT
jgi:hypothetical protein